MDTLSSRTTVPTFASATIREAVVERLAPAAGVLGTGLTFVGLMIANASTDGINPADSAAGVATTLAENADETRTGVKLALVGLALSFWFLAYLRRRIGAAEGERGALGSVAFGGGLVAFAGIVGYLAILVAESNAAIGGTGEAARTILLMQWEFAGVLAPAHAALVGATSLAIIRHRLLPFWLGWPAWPGLPLAAGLAVSGFLGGYFVVLSLIWLFAIAGAFVIRPWTR